MVKISEIGIKQSQHNHTLSFTLQAGAGIIPLDQILSLTLTADPNIAIFIGAGFGLSGPKSYPTTHQRPHGIFCKPSFEE